MYIVVACTRPKFSDDVVGRRQVYVKIELHDGTHVVRNLLVSTPIACLNSPNLQGRWS